MNLIRANACRAVVVAIVLLTTAGDGYGLPAGHVQSDAIELAQAGGTQPRELEPRYQPVPPEPPPSWYNASYIFGLTRSVAASTMIPAAKAPLFVLTVPLDLVILPFAAIGGLFG
jgi:hypothetical protein